MEDEKALVAEMATQSEAELELNMRALSDQRLSWGDKYDHAKRNYERTLRLFFAAENEQQFRDLRTRLHASQPGNDRLVHLVHAATHFVRFKYRDADCSIMVDLYTEARGPANATVQFKFTPPGAEQRERAFFLWNDGRVRAATKGDPDDPRPTWNMMELHPRDWKF